MNSNSYFEETVDTEGNTVQRTCINGTEKIVKKLVDENKQLTLDNNGWLVNETPDMLNRTQKITTKPFEQGAKNFTANYDYLNGAVPNTTSKVVEKLNYKYGNTDIQNYSYNYDNNGNITEVKENGIKTEGYSYDGMNQLLYEANIKTKTFTFYTYDCAGNITNVTVKGLSTSGWYPTTEISSTDYIYDGQWKDKLSLYNGQTIMYDAIGNPTQYLNGTSLTWESGNRLAHITKGLNNAEYKYNTQGIRTSKRVYNDSVSSSRETKYYYDDDNRLIALYGLFGNIMYFYYDNNGRLNSMSYMGENYYYVTNIQGDITKIINSSGNTIVNYSYDAWGKILSITDANGKEITSSLHVALINPFRYRGYIYDDETGFYYLKSRYYDPLIGRFINADNPSILKNTQNTLFGSNLFAYCNNNPITYVDDTGNFAVIGKVVNFFGFGWDRDQGIWYSQVDAWQRDVGYCKLYDDAAPLLGMYIETKRVKFNYKGKRWMIQLWKGRYGITLGAEIGIYVYTGTLHGYLYYNNKKFHGSMDIYRCANNSEMMRMSLTLYRNGWILFQRLRVRHWWVTGFKPYGSDGKLTTKFVIEFPTIAMKKAFCRSYYPSRIYNSFNKNYFKDATVRSTW